MNYLFDPSFQGINRQQFLFCCLKIMHINNTHRILSNYKNERLQCAFCRGFLTHSILWRSPYIACPLPFPNLVYLLSPSNLYPSAHFVALFLELSGWLCHIWCAVLLNDIMCIQMFSISTLVPEGPCCLYNKALNLLRSYTYSFTKTRWEAKKLTHPYKYITSPVSCNSSYMHYIEWIIYQYQKLTFQCPCFSKIPCL